MNNMIICELVSGTWFVIIKTPRSARKWRKINFFHTGLRTAVYFILADEHKLGIAPCFFNGYCGRVL